jgi:uncharacterized membrane protein
VLAVAATVAALSGTVDQLGRSYAEEALTRALVTFAVARTLNGVISTAQGTELSLEPGGVGVNFSIGEILDPINDLIEQFSGVMLVATTSLGLQSVLLRMTAWWGVNLLLLAAAGLVLASVWIPLTAASFGRASRRMLLILCLVRFAIPALMITSSLIFDTFLADQQTAARQALEATGTEIESFNEQAAPPTAEDPSFVDQLGTLLGDSLRSLNARQRLEDLRNQVSDAAEHVIDLIVIFVFQTIILPVVFLWSIVELLKAVITRTANL